MVRTENLPTYYKKVKPLYHRFFNEVFTQNMKFEVLESKVRRETTFDVGFFDSIYLQESITFLRRSIFNLLAYKHLVCGKHLPMAKVSLYYSYFDSISSLLRISGVAIVHVSEVTEKFEDEPRKLRFKITQHDNHTFTVNNVRQNEHKLVWNEFHKLFPNLSTEYDGRWFTQDRYEWNYGLLYPSQSTDEFAQREIRDRCDNNFLDPHFESAHTPEEAEYKHDLIANFGHEEMHAGYLIKECIKILVKIARVSEYKSDYTDLFRRIKNDVDFLESSESIKDEIKKWLDDAIEELNGA